MSASSGRLLGPVTRPGRGERRPHLLWLGGAALSTMMLAGGCGSGRVTGLGRASGSSSVPGARAAAGCANAIATEAIRSALVEANGLPGGQVVPGRTYYGVCDATSYAVAQFRAAAGATLQEQVSFQDDGSDMRFFSRPDGGAWAVVGMVPYDQDPTCAPFAALPPALKALWDNCRG